MTVDEPQQIRHERLQARGDERDRCGGVLGERRLQALGRKPTARHGQHRDRPHQHKAQHDLDRREDALRELLTARQVLLVKCR